MTCPVLNGGLSALLVIMANKKELLAIEFPPETDKSFYAREDFQTFIDHIAGANDQGLTLSQSGGFLRLFKRFPAGTMKESPLQYSFQFISELVAVIGSRSSEQPEHR